jgi:hypothetical protein
MMGPGNRTVEEERAQSIHGVCGGRMGVIWCNGLGYGKVRLGL